MAGASTAESLGQNPVDISSALGAKQSTAGAQAAQAIQQAAQQANARLATGATMQQQALAGGIAGLTDPVSKLIGSLMGINTGGTGSAQTVTTPEQAAAQQQALQDLLSQYQQGSAYNNAVDYANQEDSTGWLGF
jgi:hypothetical protein